MEQKHTKWKWEGPTEATEDEDMFYRDTASTWLSDENGDIVLVPWDYESYSCGLYISEANAHLISAAPETKRQRDALLAACRVAVLAMTHEPINPDDVKFIKQAIEQAESEGE